MREITENQANKATIITENFKSVAPVEKFGYRTQGTSALVFGYWGGKIGSTQGTQVSIENGTITLTANSTNFIYVNTKTATVEKFIGTTLSRTLIGEFSIPIAKIKTDDTKITEYEDLREFTLWNYGTNTSGTKQVFDNEFITANLTINFLHLGKLLIHQSADATARTITIPANSNTAFPIGAYFSIFNQSGAGVLTLNVNTDTLTQVGTGSLGSKIIEENGMATVTKVNTNDWIISGVGVS